MLNQLHLAMEPFCYSITLRKPPHPEPEGKEKCINIEILRAETENSIIIKIVDNGLGIKKEKLIKVFSFGFTIKVHGHGFGLHGSALSAKKLGGSLMA